MTMPRKSIIILLILAIFAFVKYKNYIPLFYEEMSIFDEFTLTGVKHKLRHEGFNFNVVEDEYVFRGNVRFTQIEVKEIETKCGRLNGRLYFFNNSLESIRYINISSAYNSDKCINALILSHAIKGNNFLAEEIKTGSNETYDILFSDNVIEEKISWWIMKWT